MVIIRLEIWTVIIAINDDQIWLIYAALIDTTQSSGHWWLCSTRVGVWENISMA